MTSILRAHDHRKNKKVSKREPGERRRERQKVTKKPRRRAEERRTRQSLEAEVEVNRKVEGKRKQKREVCNKAALVRGGMERDEVRKCG